MTAFNKPPLSITEQLDLWAKRGLSIPDPTRARRYLTVISYYRLSAYTLPFQRGTPDHDFKPGAGFIESLLSKINPGSSWRLRLNELLQAHPNVSRAHMGMPNDWSKDPFWCMS